LIQRYCHALRVSIDAANGGSRNSAVHDHKVFLAKEALVNKERLLLNDMASKCRRLSNACKVLSTLCQNHGITIPHYVATQRLEC
jgi:hypothetical protein